MLSYMCEHLTTESVHLEHKGLLQQASEAYHEVPAMSYVIHHFRVFNVLE